MKADFYTLNDNKEPVPCYDSITWGKWFESNDRHVANDEIGGVRVSTVFLGLNHGYNEPEPILFETMVFGGPHDGEMERYATWEQAEQGHRAMIEKLSAQ